MGAKTGPVALFDWDETLHDGQTMPAWVDFLEARGAINGEDALRFRGVFDVYNASAKTAEDYNVMVNDAITAYASAVSGKPVLLFRGLAQEFASLDSRNVFPFAAQLMERLKRKGVQPILVTGSALVIADVFAEKLGIECAHALKLEVEEGHFTGGIERNTGLAPIKAGIADRYAGRILLAGGDSSADMPMFERAELALVVGNGVNQDLATNHRNRYRISDPTNPEQPELWARIDATLRTVAAKQRTFGELQ